MATPSSPVLRGLRNLNVASPYFQGQLINLLDDGEYVQCIQKLGKTDLVWLVDYLDEVRHLVTPAYLSLKQVQTLNRLDDLNPPTPASIRCLHELRNICGTKELLPTPYELSLDHLSTTSNPVVSGYCDVYQGTFRNSRVCIQRVRTYTLGSPQIPGQVCRQPPRFFCRHH